ncbi:MAG: M56 family metallopeptidase, partial [Bacteroidota bacterium]
MDSYMIKFSLGLLAFWLLYVVLFEKQSNHHFKRFYLLGALLISGCLPLMTITTYIDPMPVSNIPSDTFITESTREPINNNGVIEQVPYNWSALLSSIYFIGVAIFSLRFLKNLMHLLFKIRRHERQPQGSFIYVLLQKALPPHSFFNYLFLNQTDLETDRIPKEVLIHEQTHAQQLHSLDVLLIELIQIVLWFNPLIYLFRHHIKLNHEFLADEAVLNQGIRRNAYQNILLDYLSHQQNFQLSSSIHYSSTRLSLFSNKIAFGQVKKRILIMTTKTSRKTVLLSRLVLFPLSVILFYNLAERKYVEKESNEGIERSASTDISKHLFYVTVEKKGDLVNLKCEGGCKWGNLDLEPRPEPYIINDYGFSQGNSIASDEFAFSILVNKETVVFKGLKGADWKLLNFDLQKNDKLALNELGTTELMEFDHSNPNRIDLKIRAINDELFMNDYKIPVENYSEILNVITRNWSAENHKASTPDLMIE